MKAISVLIRVFNYDRSEISNMLTMTFRKHSSQTVIDMSLLTNHREYFEGIIQYLWFSFDISHGIPKSYMSSLSVSEYRRDNNRFSVEKLRESIHSLIELCVRNMHS